MTETFHHILYVSVSHDSPLQFSIQPSYGLSAILGNDYVDHLPISDPIKCMI